MLIPAEREGERERKIEREKERERERERARERESILTIKSSTHLSEAIILYYVINGGGYGYSRALIHVKRLGSFIALVKFCISVANSSCFDASLLMILVILGMLVSRMVIVVLL